MKFFIQIKKKDNWIPQTSPIESDNLKAEEGSFIFYNAKSGMNVLVAAYPVKYTIIYKVEL